MKVEVAALFGIRRREASRIISRLQPKSKATQRGTNARRVKRSQLLQWLKPIQEKFERAAELTEKLREDEAQRQAQRAVFRHRFGEAPPAWKVTAELESATITSLPTGERLAPGKIEITFAGENPIAGCELLHALSKAMEHDWFRFCDAIAREAVEAEARERAKGGTGMPFVVGCSGRGRVFRRPLGRVEWLLEATAPATSSVPLGAGPTNPATAESPSSPAPETLPVPSPASDPIASASTGSDSTPSQDDKTQQMISNMQRMFEQRKQMMQQQQTSVPPQ